MNPISYRFTMPEQHSRTENSSACFYSCACLCKTAFVRINLKGEPQCERQGAYLISCFFPKFRGPDGWPGCTIWGWLTASDKRNQYQSDQTVQICCFAPASAKYCRWMVPSHRPSYRPRNLHHFYLSAALGVLPVRRKTDTCIANTNMSCRTRRPVYQLQHG